MHDCGQDCGEQPDADAVRKDVRLEDRDGAVHDAAVASGDVTVESHVTVGANGALIDYHPATYNGVPSGLCPPDCPMRPGRRKLIITDINLL